MKCPIDQTEMEEGHLGSGIAWGAGKGAWQDPSSKELKKIVAYKCSTCGKVELTTEEEDK